MVRVLGLALSRGQSVSGWDENMRAASSLPSSTEGQPPTLPHRCPLKTLQKCEIALEKLKNDMAVVSGVLWPGCRCLCEGLGLPHRDLEP